MIDDLLMDREDRCLIVLIRAVPQQTHFVFGAQADSMDKLQTMQEQMQRTSGYEEVKSQLHFMAEAIQPKCHLKKEICQKQYYDNLVFQAVNEWGGEEPLMQISWSENGKLHTKQVDAKGDTGQRSHFILVDHVL